MKTGAVALALIFSAASLEAEGFVNLPGETNEIAIGKGEAIVITSVFDAEADNWPQYFHDGLTNWSGLRPGAIFLGPGQLLTTNKCTVSYTRFAAPYLRILVWTNYYWTNEVTFPISVPAGKTFRLLGQTDNGRVEIRAARPGSTNFFDFIGPSFDQAQSLELIGPLELLISSLGCCNFRLWYFVEDAAQAAAAGYLVGPAGAHEIAVEKSQDLKAWSPAMIGLAPGSDPQAFYRLRITK